MGSTTIHPFPELRALAEEEARAFAEACSDAFALHMGDDTPAMYELGWDGMHDDEHEALTAAHLTLLCDLTRPMSRYAVSVLVGNRIGWDGHSIALSVETGGINIHALFRDCGFKAEPSLNAGADLALIVRHLWPEESP